MTNEYILKSIEELKHTVDPLNINVFFYNASSELKNDFYNSARIKPGTHLTTIPIITENDLKKTNRAICINAFIKLLLDCYLYSFDASNVKTSEKNATIFDDFLNSIYEIIDLLLYKGIPYKELSQYALEDTLPSMYHQLCVDLNDTYINECCQYCKTTTYGRILTFLISRKLLKQAVLLYKKYSFYISSTHFIDSLSKYLTQDDIASLDKATCELIILESEKSNLNSYFYKKEKEAMLGNKRIEELSNEEIKNLEDITVKYKNDSVVNLICEAYKLFSRFGQKESIFARIKDDLCVHFELKENDHLSWPWIDLFNRFMDIDFNNGIDETFVNLISRTTKQASRNANGEHLMFVETPELPTIGNDYRLLLRGILIYIGGHLNSNYKQLGKNQEFETFLLDLLDHYKNIIDITAKRECSIDEMGEFVDRVNDRNEQLNDKLIGEILKKRFNSLSQKQIDENCKLFFDMNRDGLGRCISPEKSQAIIEKLNNIPIFKEVIAAGEIMFLPYSDIDDDLISGDFTGLVVSQIKTVERYLKEAIVIYARKQRKNILIDKRNRNNIELTEDRASNTPNIKILIVNENTNSLDLSKGDTSVEIGPCIYFIKNVNNITDLSNNPTNSIFKKDLQKKWVNEVRNKYMHVIPIKSLSEAKEKLAKTSYWLLRVIDELKL